MEEQDPKQLTDKELSSIVKAAIKEIAIGDFDSDVNIRTDADIVQDLGFDCLDKLELQFSLEEMFGITLDDEVWNGTSKVGEIIKLVLDKVRKS